MLLSYKKNKNSLNEIKSQYHLDFFMSLILTNFDRFKNYILSKVINCNN